VANVSFWISFWISFWFRFLVNLVPVNTGSSSTLHDVQLIVYQIQKNLVFFELLLEIFVTVRDVGRSKWKRAWVVV
jgi:hypothetical protein